MVAQRPRQLGVAVMEAQWREARRRGTAAHGAAGFGGGSEWRWTGRSAEVATSAAVRDSGRRGGRVARHLRRLVLEEHGGVGRQQPWRRACHVGRVYGRAPGALGASDPRRVVRVVSTGVSVHECSLCAFCWRDRGERGVGPRRARTTRTCACMSREWAERAGPGARRGLGRRVRALVRPRV